MNRLLQSRSGVRASVDEVGALLDTCASRVLAPAASAERTFQGVITVDLYGGATASQPILITLGTRAVVHGAISWPIAWEPSAHARLLPEFRGTLRVQGDPECEIVLRGRYRPPLGAVGAIVDTVMMRNLARSSLDAFVTALAGRIDEEVAEVGAARRGLG